MNKLHFVSLLGLCLVLTSNSLANESSDQKPETILSNKYGEFTGTFDLTTDYMFRGISLSNNLPAVQGGYTYTFNKFGIYLSLWGSSTHLESFVREEDIASIELDAIVGIANSIGDHFSYDISLVRYNYPKAQSLEYNEVITKWAFTVLTSLILTAEIDYSGNVFNSKNPGTYYNGRVDYTIPSKYLFCIDDVTLSGSFGHYDLPRGAGYNSYNDYMIGIAKAISNFTFSVQWIGTNGRFNAGSLDDNRYVGMITADF